MKLTIGHGLKEYGTLYLHNNKIVAEGDIERLRRLVKTCHAQDSVGIMRELATELKGYFWVKVDGDRA